MSRAALVPERTKTAGQNGTGHGSGESKRRCVIGVDSRLSYLTLAHSQTENGARRRSVLPT